MNGAGKDHHLGSIQLVDEIRRPLEQHFRNAC